MRWRIAGNSCFLSLHIPEVRDRKESAKIRGIRGRKKQLPADHTDNRRKKISGICGRKNSSFWTTKLYSNCIIKTIQLICKFTAIRQQGYFLVKNPKKQIRSGGRVVRQRCATLYTVVQIHSRPHFSEKYGGAAVVTHTHHTKKQSDL